MAQQRVNLTDSGKDAIMKLDSNCYDLSTRKFDSTNLIHNLTTTDETKPLAADQGPAIQALLDAKADKADVTSGMVFKGTCTYATLPTTGNTNGDFWYCTDQSTNYGWNGTSWVSLGNLNYTNVTALDEDFDDLEDSFEALKTSVDIDKKASKSVADGRKISNTFDMADTVQIYDAGNAQASGIKIYGETIETGTGDKSPTNPYTIKSLGENEGKVVVRNCGKNLLPNNATTQTINGVTFTKKADGTIIMNGTSTAKTIIYVYGSSVHNDCLELTVGTYYINGCTSNDTNLYYLDVTRNEADGTRAQLLANSAGDLLITQTDVTRKYEIRIVIQSGKTLSNATIKPMIRLSSVTDSSYEPYIGSNITLPINNGTITNGLTAPLRRLSDTVYDWIDWDNGKVHRNVGKVVFDGSDDEGYGYYSNYNNPCFVTTASSSNIGYGYCVTNILKTEIGISAKPLNTLGIAIEGITTGFGFFIKPNTTAATAADFRTWLSSNNLEIYYKLKTEIIEDIDVTLLDQRLYTYEDLTNVIEETSIQGKLDMTYVGRNNNYANDITNNKKYLFYLQMDGSQPQLVTREV